MDKTISLNINVINGELFEFPMVRYFRSDLLIPMGQTIIRFFDDALCSVAHRTFYFRYGSENDLFGTDQFKTVAEYWQFLGAMERVDLLLGNCLMQIDGVTLNFNF